MTIVAFCGSVVVLLCASTVIVPSAVPSAFLRVSQPASVVAFQLTFSALTSIVLGVSGVAVKVRVPGVALSLVYERYARGEQHYEHQHQN